MEQGNLLVLSSVLARGLFSSIRTRLIIYFSLLFAVVLVLVGLINIFGIPFSAYSGRQGQQREEAFHSLELIADLKEEQLERWITERRDDAHMISDNDIIRNKVAQLLEKVTEYSTSHSLNETLLLLQQEQVYREILDLLNSVRFSHEVYDTIYLTDVRTGTVWISTDDTLLGRDIHQQTSFTQVLEDEHIYVSDIQIGPRSERPHLYLNHIIIDADGEPIAVMVMQISTGDIFRPLLHTGIGLGEKGEALLVNQDREILNPLKHPLADGSLARPLDYQINAQPAARAAGGAEGFIETEDYRGEPVLAAYRNVEVSSEGGWGMVVKLDRAELFAPLRQDILYTLVIGMVGLLAVVGFTVIIAGSLTKPLLDLSQTAQQVAEGNLEARAPVASSDEVGRLAAIFNAMVQRIQNWYVELEAQVQTRTAELAQVNEELKLEIMERQRMEKALQQSRLRYQMLFERMLDGYALHEIICDKNGRPIDYKFLDINPAFEKLTGLNRDIVGKTVLEILPGTEQYWIDTYGQVALTGQPLNFENYSDAVGGGWYEVIVFRPAAGQFATIFRDVTERKQAEKERERLNRDLLDKNKELEQIVYVTSHDLRSPLVNIQGFSREMEHAFKDVLAALQRPNVPAELRRDLAPILEDDIPESLQYIFSSTAKMDSLLSGLLRLSRLGRTALNIEKLDANKVISNISDVFEFRLQTIDAELEIGDLPPCWGDETQISQVFANLVDNALKYLSPDRSGIIRISGRNEGKEVIYCVEDNGIGIAPEHQQKIYEIFHRLNPDQNQGEGLGLTIVHRILDRHRGKIWVESEPGHGSKFFVLLPASRPKKKEETSSDE